MTTSSLGWTVQTSKRLSSFTRDLVQRFMYRSPSCLAH